MILIDRNIVYLRNTVYHTSKESRRSSNVAWSLERFFWNRSSSCSNCLVQFSLCSWILRGQPRVVHLTGKHTKTFSTYLNIWAIKMSKSLYTQYQFNPDIHQLLLAQYTSTIAEYKCYRLVRTNMILCAVSWIVPRLRIIGIDFITRWSASHNATSLDVNKTAVPPSH